MLGTPSDRKPCAQSSQLLVLVVSTNLRDWLPSAPSLLVKVDGDIRNQRFPTELQKQRRVVKRTGRGIDHMAVDAAVLAGRVGLLAEFEERVLSGEALPALVTTQGGSIRPVESPRRCSLPRTSRNREAGAIRVGAIDRARYPQVGG